MWKIEEICQDFYRNKTLFQNQFRPIVFLPYKGCFVTKIVLSYCEKKNCSFDLEKLLKFEGDFSLLKSDGEGTERFFNLFLEVSQI